MQLKLNEITLDWQVAIRERLDEETVERYKDCLGKLPPIAVFSVDSKYLLADGFHRREAAIRKGWEEIAAEIKEGSYQDALEYAIEANLRHGKPLTRQEQQNAVRRLKTLHPEWGYRKLAGAIGRSQNFVETVVKSDEVRTVLINTVLDDSKLEQIYPAPKEQWAEIAKAAGQQSLTVVDIQDKVRQINLAPERAAEILAPTVIEAEGEAQVAEAPLVPEVAGAVEAVKETTTKAQKEAVEALPSEGVAETRGVEKETLREITEQPSVSKHKEEVSIASVIGLLDKLDRVMQSYADELREDWGFTTRLNSHHSKLHRFSGLCPECIAVPKWQDGICPNCGMEEAEIIAEEKAEEQRQLEDEQARVLQETLRETLLTHPIWRYVKELVVTAGKNAGEPRSEKWVQKRYGQSYNGIAQELGYEDGGLPPIGHRPSHDMLPDERFRWDLMEGFRVGVQAGLIKARLTSRAKGKGRKQSTGAFRASMIAKWEAKERPWVQLPDGTMVDDLNLVPTPKLKKIRRLLETGQVIKVNGRHMLLYKR